MVTKKYKLESADTVFILIDMQEKLMKVMSHREKVYRNNGILMELAHRYEMPVVACEQYPKGMGPTVPEIQQVLPGDHYRIEKLNFSAFTDKLKEILKSINRNTVIITGSEAHICVLQTTRDLLGAGYNVHVVRDAICSRFKENYLNALELMREMGAVVTNTETVAFDILTCAGTPEFKAISKIIK